MAFEMENDPGWQFLRLSREEMIKDQATPFDSKKNVWVPDKEEGFIAAKVISTKADGFLVSVKGKEMTIKKDLVQPMNPPKYEKTEDMSNLTILNDACVLHNLRARYKKMLIYTYSGLFCVVINPSKRLPIYTDSVAKMYIGKRRTEMPPHLFAVSDEAYRNMLQDHENQSILITGESGAGKTENTKKVIAYFATVGTSQSSQLPKNENEKKVTLEDQIVQTNPVLEAFGNARTVRNNNSSRFGKFIRIHFSRTGKVASCDIEHYLLEKSRVIRQAPGERCYHIFYQMFSDYRPELKPMLLLERPLRDYWFVAQAELTVDGMDDSEEFRLTDEAFDILHFTEEEKLNCYRLMSAHMHIGIMKFKQRPREEQAEPDGTDEAEKASKMYGVSCDDLLKAFTHPRVKVGVEWVNRGQNLEQVNWAVGAMGKAIYARVFHWLVNKCNYTLDQKGIPRDYFIGVLDIAGFEIFDFNSFEQLWINFVNEKLQQFFNHHMFVLEQEEYARESIQWTFIDFGLDLQACIELIEKPMGIISMLDEECIVPKANEQTLAQKINEQHLGKHPNFEKAKPPKGKQAEAHFAMRHYAGIVRYNVSNWLEKNKDPLNDTVAACLKASPDNALLNEIWADYVTMEEASHIAKSEQVKKKGKSGSFMTVSMLYRESLNKLMMMLYKTHPHFIRCIIPNECKRAGLLDAALVLNQLTCNGVLEGIRICRKGFPNRMLHADFVQRYVILATAEAYENKNVPKDCSSKMLDRMIQNKWITPEMYKIGLSKVFFKAGVLAHLEDLRDAKLNEIFARFQAQIRFYHQMLDLVDRRNRYRATLLIQRNAHAYVNMITWSWFILFVNTMPIVRESRVEETLEQLKVQVEQTEKLLSEKRDGTSTLNEQIAKVAAEKSALLSQIANSDSSNIVLELEIEKLSDENVELEKTLSEMNEKLGDEQRRTSDETATLRKLTVEMEELRKSIHEVELEQRKIKAEKLALDGQLKALRDEIRQQDEMLIKVDNERKHQDEMIGKLEEDMRAEEDRSTQGEEVEKKLQSVMKECDEKLAQEKQTREEVEKSKRQADGSLKIAQETLHELEKQHQDLESGLKKRQLETHELEVRTEQMETKSAGVLKQMKQDEARLHELEQSIESENQARVGISRATGELKLELDELEARVDEQHGATAAQLEQAKKHQNEIAKLRVQLESSKLDLDNSLGMARKKTADAVANLNEQLSRLRSGRSRTELELANLRRQLELELSHSDTEAKSRAQLERYFNDARFELQDLQTKTEMQTKNVLELNTQHQYALSNRSTLGQELHELNEQANSLVRLKSQQLAEIEQYERSHSEQMELARLANANVANLQHEVDRLKELLESELDDKNELERMINRADNEVEQLRRTLEANETVPAEFVEETKRKQAAEVVELQDSLDAANATLAELEKTKLRLSIAVDDAMKEAEQQLSLGAQLEKKLKRSEVEMNEWRRKADDLSNELDRGQMLSRSLTAELYNEQAGSDQLSVKIDALRNDNLNLSQECAELRQQLHRRDETVSDLRKVLRRDESEKDELHQMLDEAEAAIQADEMKVARMQLEIKQMRAETEKRIQEKEEEFDNIQRTVANNLQAIQLNAENEKKERNELQKTCKKLQQDVHELCLALDHANLANEDAQKNIKRYATQIVELQNAIVEVQQRRDAERENLAMVEKNLSASVSQKDELNTKLQQAELAKKQQDGELIELKTQLRELEAQSSQLNTTKKKLEADVTLLKREVKEARKEYTMSDDAAKTSALEAARLSEQLREAQNQSQGVERENKKFELELKQMQNRIDDVENEMRRGGSGGHKTENLVKLDERLKTLNLEIENEHRRAQDALKDAAKQERREIELQFQVDEADKQLSQLRDSFDKLQLKIKEQKKAIESREDDADVTLRKYKQLQLTLGNAEERANAAEESMKFIRSSRSSTIQ